MEKVNPLGEKKISKLLIQFSVPAIVGMMANALYNIVDRIFIGNKADLGAYGIAAITISFPIMILLIALGVLFGIGGSTLFAIKLGQKKENDAENALGNAFSLLLIAGLAFSILGQVFLTQILTIFGTSSDVMPFATEYMRIIFMGASFQVMSMGMNNFIRADGNPKIAMMSMFLGAGINMILDPIFIFVLDMGMAGAALATVISQICASIWVVGYFFGKRSRSKLKRSNMRLKKTLVLSIISLGIPLFALQLANSLLNIVLNKSLISYGGDLGISAMGIVNSLQTLLIMPVIGINQGVLPIISFNFGARQFDRVKEAAKLGILAATALVMGGFLATRFFPYPTCWNVQPGARTPQTWKLRAQTLVYANPAHWIPDYRGKLLPGHRKTAIGHVPDPLKTGDLPHPSHPDIPLILGLGRNPLCCPFC